jgi:hypothetical protein
MSTRASFCALLMLRGSFSSADVTSASRTWTQQQQQQPQQQQYRYAQLVSACQRTRGRQRA